MIHGKSIAKKTSNFTGVTWAEERVKCCPVCCKPYLLAAELDSHMELAHPTHRQKVLITCIICRSRGTQRELYPWVYINDMQVKCLGCSTEFNIDKHITWEGHRDVCCMKCGPLCEVCLKLKFRCDYCQEVVSVRHECPGEKSYWVMLREWVPDLTGWATRIQGLDQTQEAQFETFLRGLGRRRRRILEQRMMDAYK